MTFHFAQAIRGMNATYELPVKTNLTPPDMVADLKAFKKILAEELDEIDEIIEDVEKSPTFFVDYFGTLADIGDLLGDLQVYCASEMVKYNIPIDPTLEIIMASNDSKLGADGKPIKRADGKFLKGPNYWKPESKIKMMILNHWAAASSASTQEEPRP